jgi:MFS family permease
MFAQIRRAGSSYPRQFWLMFWGMLISATGASMIWPFLMIYVSEQLKLPLIAVTSLMTLSSVMGLIASVIAGPIIDRAGRKWVMAISLGLNATGYFFMSRAHTLPEFALLMALNGAVNPLYRVGADAMMADLIPPDKRIDAYSLMRLANNVGVALGPSLGGFIAAVSYAIAFYCAAAGLLAYGLLMALFAVETLPARHPAGRAAPPEKFGGYGAIWRDRPFVSFTFNFALVQVCSAVMWVLLAVYAKERYQVSEAQFGWIPTTNATMVLLFQFGLTQVSKRYRPLRVMALGALFYAVATLSIAFGQGFWAFWASMAVMTVGELLLVPTSSTYAANLAPADKRGRYMSLYGLTWGAATAVGPVFGGLLNDTLGPRAIWYGAAAVGFVSVAGFLRLREARAPASGAPMADASTSSG